MTTISTKTYSQMLEDLASAREILDQLEPMEPITSPTPARPRSIGIPWAAVALGAVIGAGIVAIAGLVL